MHILSHSFLNCCIYASFSIQEWVDFGKVLVWTWETLYIGGNRITSRRASGTYLQLLTSVAGQNILTASFASDPNAVAVVVMDIYGMVSAYMVNHVKGSFSRSSFLSNMHPDYIPVGTLNMRFFESAKETLFLWNATMIWYSFYDDTIAGMLTIYGMADFSLAAKYSIVHEVILGESFSCILVSCCYYTVTQYGNMYGKCKDRLNYCMSY